MDPYFAQQLGSVAPVVGVAYPLAHAQCRSKRAVRCRKGRHHRVARSLDDRTRLSGDDPVENLEMRSDEVEGGEVADLLVELGRPPEIGEQKGQAGDLEPLVDIDRVGAVD